MEKKKIRFYEDGATLQGINIFPLSRDDRINKSPYRMMKKHLDREVLGKNIKITGHQRQSKIPTISTYDENHFDQSSAMNLKYILSKDLTKNLTSKAQAMADYQHKLLLKK